MILKKDELITIKGGAISASWLNYITRAISLLFEIGRSIGSSIRRAYTHNYC